MKSMTEINVQVLSFFQHKMDDIGEAKRRAKHGRKRGREIYIVQADGQQCSSSL